MHRLLVLISLWLLLGASSWAQQVASYALSAEQQVYPIGQALAYLPGHAKAGFADIHALDASQWQINPRQSLTVPPSTEGVWGRFELSNHTEQTRWLLVVKWPLIDRMRVQLYYPLRDAWGPLMQDGDSVPMPEQASNHRYLLYPLELPAHEQVVVYFHAQAHETIALPMQVLTQDALNAQESEQAALIYLFFGGMIVILLYNACLYVFTRDACYITYIFYLICMVGYQLTLTGLGQLYVWGDYTRFTAKAYGIFGCLSFFAALIFARYFLQLKNYGGWIYHSNTAFIGYWVVMCSAVVFAPDLAPYLLPTLMPIATTFVSIFITLYLWHKGNVSAKHFTIAWMFLVVFTLVHLLAVAGHLPLTPLTLGSQMIGVYIEFILLSIALAERINREREQRVAAQQDALIASQQLAQAHEEKLRAQQEALALQDEAKTLLEVRVAERTYDLEQTQTRLEHAIRELAELSIKDSLTQLYNRRHFDATAPSEIARAKRTQVPVSVLMIDIDHFKKVNDHYGHLFGDECLRQVAKIIDQHSQRAGDLAARYGGEEFVVLLPATTLERAQQLAERIRHDVAELSLAHPKGALQPTLSVGVASLDLTADADIQTLMHDADLALYQAKKSGRNRVCLHQERVNS